MTGTLLETFAQTATPEVQTMLVRYASGKGFDQVGGPPGGGVAGLSVAQTRAVQAQALKARQIGTQGINVVGNG